MLLASVDSYVVDRQILFHSSTTVPGRSELLTILRNDIVDTCCVIGDSGNLASGTELIAALSTLR